MRRDWRRRKEVEKFVSVPAVKKKGEKASVMLKKENSYVHSSEGRNKEAGEGNPWRRVNQGISLASFLSCGKKTWRISYGRLSASAGRGKKRKEKKE